MPPLQLATEAVAFGLLFLFGGTVAILLLNGGINLHGIMKVKLPKGAGTTSPLRAQMLIIALGVAGAWLGLVLESLGSGEVPAVPKAWVAALGASQAAYLVGKFRNFISIGDVIRSLLKTEDA